MQMPDFEDHFNNLIHYGDFGNIIIYDSELIAIQKNKDFEIYKKYSSGMSIELERDGNWAFAYSPRISREELSKLISKLYKKLIWLPPAKSLKISDIESNKASVNINQDTNKDSRWLEEKSEIVNNVAKLLNESNNTSFEITYTDEIINWELHNTAGSKIHSIEHYPGLHIKSTIKAFDNTYTSISRAITGNSDSSIINEKNIDDMINDIQATESNIKKCSHKIKQGKYHVITDSRATAAMVHEMFGHTSELSNYRKATDIITNSIGIQIFPEMVTILDDPSLPNTNGFFMYDQEGIKSNKKILIDRGVRKGYISSIETANELDIKNQGSTRSMSFNIRPSPRMSNIYMAPGDYDEEELVSTINEGVAIYGNKGARINAKLNNLRLFPEYGRIIHNGELKEYVSVASIVGDAYSISRNISGVGKKTRLYRGWCHKNKEFLPVTDGGPMLKIKNVIING